MKENLKQFNRTKFLEDKTDCLKDSIIQLYHIYLNPLCNIITLIFYIELDNTEVKFL